MIRKLLAALVACFIASPATAADDYPTRPVTIVVPFTPGGGTDMMARIIAEKLTQSLGKPVIVDNKPGAGGTLGVDHVGRAEPNGYNLLFAPALIRSGWTSTRRLTGAPSASISRDSTRPTLAQYQSSRVVSRTT